MSTTLLTWTIVLGGWILPEVGSPVGATPPNVAIESPRSGNSGSRGAVSRAPVQVPRSESTGIVSPYGQAQSPHGQGQSPYSQGQSPYMSPSQASRHRIPAIPTAPDAGQQGMAQPTGPYAGPAPTMQYGSRATGVPQMPYSPTGAPGTPGYRQQSTVQPARIGTGIVGSPGIAPEIVKPFSNYQQLPIISPYLNLDRRDGLDFDNYNTLVRPFVEQDQRNNQLQNEVQVLQNTINQQHRAIQQMNRQSELYQGQAQPRYFQDTGGYFPNP